MQWDDDVLKENDVLISERHSESTDDTCQNVQELSSTVELVVFVDQGEETLVNSLSNHLSSWDKLGIQLM